MNYIENLMKATHIAVENRPEPYGLFHLIFTVGSLLLIAVICFLARKSSDKTFRIVMFGVGAFLLLSEGYKQLYYYYAAGSAGYDWYIFPFQLCSTPMYLSVAVGCMKKSRIRDAICNYLVAIGLLGGIMAYIEPSGILNGYYFTLIHSCVWHALLVFMGIYALATGNACRCFKGYTGVIAVLGGVVLTATVLNVLLHKKPSFNMCYISPYYNTPLAVFSDFDVFFQGVLGRYPGRVASILIYLIALMLGGLLIYAVSYGIVRRGRSRGRRPL